MRTSRLNIIIHILLILEVVLSFLLALFFETRLSITILLFFGIPALTLTIFSWRQVPHAFLISLIISIPMSLLIDYMGIINDQWQLRGSYETIRFLKPVSFIMLIWGFLSIYTIVLYYSLFIHKLKGILYHKIIWPFLGILTIFFLIQKIRPSLLQMDYAYLTLGTIFTMITFFIWMLSSRRSNRIFFTLPYFFILGLLFELAAVYNDLWYYPGNYLFQLTIGPITFPVEELIFWNICLPFCVSVILESIQYKDINNDQ